MDNVRDEMRRRVENFERLYPNRYNGPVMGQRPNDGEVYELAQLFLAGDGYWHCGPCGKWHRDDPESEMMGERDEA